MSTSVFILFYFIPFVFSYYYFYSKIHYILEVYRVDHDYLFPFYIIGIIEYTISVPISYVLVISNI